MILPVIGDPPVPGLLIVELRRWDRGWSVVSTRFVELFSVAVVVVLTTFSQFWVVRMSWDR